MFWKLRVGIAFIGIVILLLTGTIDLPTTIEFMNLDVIIFLIGMMVVVGLLRRSNCFRWMLFRIIKAAKFRVNLIMVVLLVLAAVMAAFLDEVTSILLMSTLVLDLCDFYRISPVNYIISVVLATNIGSSWTVLGNPVGVMIALRSGLTFEDYIVTALPVGVITLISLIIIILVWQKGDLKNLHEKIQANSRKDQELMLGEWCEVKDKKMFWGSLLIFIIVIVGLALHYRLELAMGLAHNTLLVGFAIAGAGVAMLWRKNEAKELLTKDVDWWTLIFFMFIFAKAGSLKYVGITDIVSN
jgi:Na+/H+ antiporter NhaD/arsenite permease-like protein